MQNSIEQIKERADQIGWETSDDVRRDLSWLLTEASRFQMALANIDRVVHEDETAESRLKSIDGFASEFSMADPPYGDIP